MGTAKLLNSLNKTLQLTGIGLAVQAFYINLTLDSALGGEYLQLAPIGSPVINPASVWDINGVPLQYGYGGGGGGSNVASQRVGTAAALGGQNYDANGFRDQNGYYLGNAGVKDGYEAGKTYGGARDYGVVGIQGNAFGDVNGRNKGHQVAGFSTSYATNESGNKSIYYDDGLGHGGAVQYGLRDQRYRDGAGNAYGGGVHDSSLKTNDAGNQGAYGNAGGYRNTDIGGGHFINNDLYKAGLAQAGGAGIMGPIGPLTLPPVSMVQQPLGGSSTGIVGSLALPPPPVPIQQPGISSRAGIVGPVGSLALPAVPLQHPGVGSSTGIVGSLALPPGAIQQPGGGSRTGIVAPIGSLALPPVPIQHPGAGSSLAVPPVPMQYPGGNYRAGPVPIVQQPLALIQRPVPIASAPVAQPYAVKSSPYVIPTPNKLYIDRPSSKNALTTTF